MSDVADAVFLVRPYVGDRARPEIGAALPDGHLQQAFRMRKTSSYS